MSGAPNHGRRRLVVEVEIAGDDLFDGGHLVDHVHALLRRQQTTEPAVRLVSDEREFTALRIDDRSGWRSTDIEALRSAGHVPRLLGPGSLGRSDSYRWTCRCGKSSRPTTFALARAGRDRHLLAALRKLAAS